MVYSKRLTLLVTSASDGRCRSFSIGSMRVVSRRFLCQKHSTNRSAKSTMPPTTPPAISPTCDFDFEVKTGNSVFDGGVLFGVKVVLEVGSDLGRPSKFSGSAVLMGLTGYK